MANRPRRAIPDNLDPLVDTLANVVGILVIVIVLTQIELGDALTRVIELDAARLRAEASHADGRSALEDGLAERAAALARRSDEAPEQAIDRAREVLAELESLPPEGPDAATAAADGERVRALRSELDRVREAARERERYAAEIREVPARLVARLPNPEIVRGTESWVLVRYGRVYPVDREKLFDVGSDGIARILKDGVGRPVRDDEFEAIALYLRKRPIGDGNFRWRLETEGTPRVELHWESRDGGIDRARLDSDPRWRAWLAERSPDRDFVRFHVWNDSFETYLAARQSVEAAGLRAGWRGYPSDRELESFVRFGPRPGRVRDVRVD